MSVDAKVKKGGTVRPRTTDTMFDRFIDVINKNEGKLDKAIEDAKFLGQFLKLATAVGAGTALGTAETAVAITREITQTRESDLVACANQYVLGFTPHMYRRADDTEEGFIGLLKGFHQGQRRCIVNHYTGTPVSKQEADASRDALVTVLEAIGKHQNPASSIDIHYMGFESTPNCDPAHLTPLALTLELYEGLAERRSEEEEALARYWETEVDRTIRIEEADVSPKRRAEILAYHMHPHEGNLPALVHFDTREEETQNIPEGVLYLRVPLPVAEVTDAHLAGIEALCRANRMRRDASRSIGQSLVREQKVSKQQLFNYEKSIMGYEATRCVPHIMKNAPEHVTMYGPTQEGEPHPFHALHELVRGIDAARNIPALERMIQQSRRAYAAHARKNEFMEYHGIMLDEVYLALRDHLKGLE